MARSVRFAPLLKLLKHERFYKLIEGKRIMPINIEFSPSGVCNTNCSKCFYRQDNFALKGWEKVFIDTQRAKKLLVEFAICGVKSVSWTGGGEPTMHPDFKELSETAKECFLEQGLFTNALRTPEYDPSLFEWIRVTKTDNPLNMDNLMYLRGCKTLGIVLNYTPGDDDQVDECIKAVEALDKMKTEGQETYLQIRSFLYINGGKHNIKPPDIKHPLVQITQYKFLNEDRGYNECRAYHITPFVWQNGDVDVCGYHKGEKDYHLGSIYEKSFYDIMSNAPEKVNVIPTCQEACKLHEMNCYLEDLTNLKDINFI